MNMNVICSDPAPLTVENNVDLALPPLDFVYINEYVVSEKFENIFYCYNFIANIHLLYINNKIFQNITTDTEVISERKNRNLFNC